jgi:hypothetical protein
MEDRDLAPGEIELLIAGMRDTPSSAWALVHLDIRSKSHEAPGAPSAADVEAASASLSRLAGGGCVGIGRREVVPGGKPDGRGPAPHRHLPEDSGVARRRVDRICAGAREFRERSFSCWIENTPKGRSAARRALSAHPACANREGPGAGEPARCEIRKVQLPQAPPPDARRHPEPWRHGIRTPGEAADPIHGPRLGTSR